MAIGLEEKKSSSLQKILIALFAVLAVFALIFFGTKNNLIKNAGQEEKEPVLEVKTINIDFAFLNSNIISNLKSFPSFPSFFGSSSSSSPVEPGRENPFIPYQLGAAPSKQGTSSEIDLAKKGK
jgi:hypothetical protein